MAKRNEAVMSLVESQLKKNPDVSTQELYEKTVEKHPEIKKLTLRQFNARYPLQVKRAQSPRKKKSSAKKKTSRTSTRKSSAGQDGRREQVRRVLLSFAQDLTSSDDRGHLVKVLANVDTYADKIIKI